MPGGEARLAFSRFSLSRLASGTGPLLGIELPGLKATRAVKPRPMSLSGDLRCAAGVRPGARQQGGPIRLTIFGASGRTGKHLVDQALDLGYEVTAVVRDPDRLEQHGNRELEVVRAYVMDPEAIAPAVARTDAVVTAISGPGREPSTVWSDSARSIIAAMRKVGARRLVAITGSMNDDSGDGPFFRYIAKPLVRRILRGSSQDMCRAEQEIHRSGLDWTIVRAPRLTDKPATGRYRSATERNVRREFSLSREDLATSVLNLLDDQSTVNRHVFVAQ
jgi:putative NADH-flavin reductase